MSPQGLTEPWNSSGWKVKPVSFHPFATGGDTVHQTRLLQVTSNLVLVFLPPLT